MIPLAPKFRNRGLLGEEIDRSQNSSAAKGGGIH
jgi:hypothetical protein